MWLENPGKKRGKVGRFPGMFEDLIGLRENVQLRCVSRNVHS
jgi:hypothetical protein